VSAYVWRGSSIFFFDDDDNFGAVTQHIRNAHCEPVRPGHNVESVMSADTAPQSQCLSWVAFIISLELYAVIAFVPQRRGALQRLDHLDSLPSYFRGRRLHRRPGQRSSHPLFRRAGILAGTLLLPQTAPSSPASGPHDPSGPTRRLWTGTRVTHPGAFRPGHDSAKCPPSSYSQQSFRHHNIPMILIGRL